MGRLVVAEFKPLLRAWFPLVLAALASATYVVGEALQAPNGWASVGLIAGSWMALWFYLAFFPTALAYGWFRSDAQREITWPRKASTPRQLVAKALALLLVGLGLWSSIVVLALVTMLAAQRSELAMPWSLAKAALFGLPSVGFGLALLFFIAALVQNRILAYGLATAYFLLVLVFSTPERPVYLLPFFTPTSRLVSEFVGFGFFAPVMYLQKAYVLAFTAALFFAAVYFVSRRRRPRDAVSGTASLVFLFMTLALALILMKQPPQSAWVEKNREEWTALAALAGSGVVPAGDLFYRTFTHRQGGKVLRMAAFAPPAKCQLAFVNRYLETLALFERQDRLASVAEAPFRISATIKGRVLLLPERYRFREGSWCERSAVREAVDLLIPRPNVRRYLGRGEAAGAADWQTLKRSLKEAEHVRVARLLAAWYAVEQLLGTKALEEELRLWDALRTGLPAHEALQRSGAIGAEFATSGDGVGKALDRWRRQDRGAILDLIAEEIAARGRGK